MQADNIFPISPILPISPDNSMLGQGPLNERLPTAALLSVPLDCDASLWSSFVDSSLWQSREVSAGEDGPLMEHFMRIASTTVVLHSIPSR